MISLIYVYLLYLKKKFSRAGSPLKLFKRSVIEVLIWTECTAIANETCV